ncbi:MAG: DUF2220 family protein [Campylobacterota bacterium]|nr:DUF2220 family protein [Campylobacterota bacterium]
MSKFYNKEEIFVKAFKIYSSGKLFVDYIESTELFPLEIKLKRLKQKDIVSDFSTLFGELNSFEKLGLRLDYKEYNFKSIGHQRLPTSVFFDDRDTLLGFIKKREEFELFKTTFNKIINRFTVLKEMLLEKPFLVMEFIEVWDRLFIVCDFFLKNKRANIYIRELGIQTIDTKFVEKYKKILDKLLMVLLDDSSIDREIISLSNYGFEKKYFLKYPLPRVRFRILDSTQTIAGLSDISLNIQEFKNLHPTCRVVYIVENKITTLSFVPLKDSMVIFGSGYGVEILKDVEWLKRKDIFYWGDIDSDGFAILSLARGYFKDIKSLMMDKQTLEKFRYFGVESKHSTCKDLKNLTRDEAVVYKMVVENNFRLEQEKIDFTYVKKTLYNEL